MITTAELSVLRIEKNNAVLQSICPECKKKQEIAVPILGLMAYQRGAHIQNAFPKMTADERELLKTGICKECWDVLFKEPEDDRDPLDDMSYEG